MDFNQLSKAPLFNGLSAEETETILKSVPNRIKIFQAGSLISQSGEQINSLIIVIRGVVKGEMVDYTGRVIKIEDIPAPGALASAFIFGSRNRFPVNVLAVTDGELLMIEKSDFLKLLMLNHIILVNFLNMISNRSQFLSEKIKFLNFKTIKSKLAHYILEKSGNDKSSVIMELTQSDLADFFGVARPSLARALGNLAEEGFLEVKGKNIKIIDKKGLADFSID